MKEAIHLSQHWKVKESWGGGGHKEMQLIKASNIADNVLEVRVGDHSIVVSVVDLLIAIERLFPGDEEQDA